MAMPMAAAEPTVPGATGEYPQPNQVEMTLATLVRIIIRGAGLQSCGRRPRRPVPARTWLFSLGEERILEDPRRTGVLPHKIGCPRTNPRHRLPVLATPKGAPESRSRTFPKPSGCRRSNDRRD